MGTSWRSDAQAVLEICDKHSLTGALERSRSGNGGHIWFFFEEATPARLARNLGSFLLTEAMEHRPEIGLKSYDRLFPKSGHAAQGWFWQFDCAAAAKAAQTQGKQPVC